eukprot:gene15021-biopygen6240
MWMDHVDGSCGWITWMDHVDGSRGWIMWMWMDHVDVDGSCGCGWITMRFQIPNNPCADYVGGDEQPRFACRAGGTCQRIPGISQMDGFGYEKGEIGFGSGMGGRGEQGTESIRKDQGGIQRGFGRVLCSITLFVSPPLFHSHCGTMLVIPSPPKALHRQASDLFFRLKLSYRFTSTVLHKGGTQFMPMWMLFCTRFCSLGWIVCMPVGVLAPRSLGRSAAILMEDVSFLCNCVRASVVRIQCSMKPLPVPPKHCTPS